MSAVRAVVRRAGSAFLVLATAVSGLTVLAVTGATPADAAVPPVVARPAGAVTADGLPTTQINGVAWVQLVVGNTVYVGGQFTTARPAGSPAGTNEVTRNNLLAYDINTGVLIDSFVPSVNAQVKTLAVSPDGSRLYVGGTFTAIDGVSRFRLAAFSTATGALLSSFAPGVDSTVTAMAATDTTLYVGGYFTTGNGVSRTRLAAFNATNGALLGWAPTADADVNSMALTPDGSKVIVGGKFKNMNASPAYGMGAVDAASGALLPWQINTVVLNAGASAGIIDLSVDDSAVYGSSFNYGTGNYEGTFSANPADGTINWLDDCHGDTYDSFSTNGVVYNVGHAHYCVNAGGFPDTSPRTKWYRAMAFTKSATGTVLKNGQSGSGYGNFEGQPAPSIIDWFPDLAAGTYTGQSQGPWSLSGNSEYLVAGGEFPTVNGVQQQGLVRFAVPSKSPNKVGPELGGNNWIPTVSLTGTSANIAFPGNWDRDDLSLTYQLFREDKFPTPVYTTTADSKFWSIPKFTFRDSGLTPGKTYRYWLKAIDPSGNVNFGANVYLTVPADATQSAYAAAVLADGASGYWRMGDPTGTVAADWSGLNNLTKGAGVTANPTGALAGDTDGASAFSGTSTGIAATTTIQDAPTEFSVEAWIKTTSTTGGKIVGFGSLATGSSTTHDRNLYMDNSGKIVFGATSARVITSTASFNDGAWHQVAASMSSAGIKLFVDGAPVAVDPVITSANSYAGYWRVGGDNLTSWPSKPSSAYLNGSIDEVAVYPNALTQAQVLDHFTLSGRTASIPAPPTDVYGAAVYGDAPNLFWRLDEASGTAAADTSPYKANGLFSGTSTKGVVSTVGKDGGTAVGFNGSTGTLGSTQTYASPKVYSQELWFKTTTTTGGKLIGLGNRQTGNSTSFDRQIYMLNNGQVSYGIYSGGYVVVTSPNTYRDGNWHHVVATQGADGMKLYVDGAVVGSNAAVTPQTLTGYWRVGGDAITSWPSKPNSGYFNGAIDEVAIYPKTLSPADVLSHFQTSNGSPNASPTASFQSSCDEAVCSFDASASADSDGTITSYEWNFGDTTTGVGVTANRTYAASGTYNVSLKVTDNKGASTTKTVAVVVTIPPPNQAPTAAFTSTCDNQSCTFDAATSSDPDGSIASYSWKFGDGTTGTGVAPAHNYVVGGGFQVELTVTDNKGLTAEVTHTVVAGEAPNQSPVAAFDAASTGLDATFDAGGSTDDGTITTYQWSFGDGTTGTGAQATHTYAGTGFYAVTLTVTDNKGATGSVSKSSVLALGTVAVADSFTRTTTGKWDNADTGGAWTLTTPSAFSTTGTAGKMLLAAAGANPAAQAKSVSALDVNLVADSSINGTPNGSGAMFILMARKSTTADYRFKLRYLSTGKFNLVLTKVVSGVETSLKEIAVSGLTYAPGDVLRVRFQVSGTGTATLAGKVWKAGTPEPATSQVTSTDATAALQVAGWVAVNGYLTGSATNGPFEMSVDNFLVTAV